MNLTKPYGDGVGIKRAAGRVLHGDADWGRVWTPGDALACCGCLLGSGRRAPICDECACHTVARFIRSGPEYVQPDRRKDS